MIDSYGSWGSQRPCYDVIPLQKFMLKFKRVRSDQLTLQLQLIYDLHRNRGVKCLDRE